MQQKNRTVNMVAKEKPRGLTRSFSRTAEHLGEVSRSRRAINFLLGVQFPAAIPILLGLALHCRRFRIFDLKERRGYCGGTGISDATCADTVLTRELAATASCRDGDEPTARQTEGPFFKPRSPERSDLRELGA